MRYRFWICTAFGTRDETRDWKYIYIFGRICPILLDIGFASGARSPWKINFWIYCSIDWKWRCVIVAQLLWSNTTIQSKQPYIWYETELYCLCDCFFVCRCDTRSIYMSNRKWIDAIGDRFSSSHHCLEHGLPVVIY